MTLGLVICAVLALAVCAQALPHQRIVNGTDALDGEFPFAVSLRRASSGSHTCGASILSPLWVLTAAHCVASQNPADFEVQYGGVHISEDAVNVIQVAAVKMHAKYSPQNQFENDIAVLRLKSPIPLNNYTAAVTLPARMQDTPGGSDATLIGWGLDESGGDVQETLQKVDYFIPDHEQCRRIHGYIHDSNICAYYPGGGKGQCSGDSGGPLLVDGEQVGVVSWSIKPCASAPYPGVLTRVSHFIDWIANTTGLEV